MSYNPSAGTVSTVSINNTSGITGIVANPTSSPGITLSITAATLDSGYYTPTLTGVANVTAYTPYECQWMRVMNTVTVSGRVDIDPTTTTTSTQLGISLPITSNFGASEDCAGVAFQPAVAGQGGAILGDTTNDRAQLQFLAGDVVNRAMYFIFQYYII